MHKKLSAELIHLAHQVIKMNKDTDISILQNKAREIYENLSVLYFIDDYFVEGETPEVTDDKSKFIENLKNLTQKPKKESVIIKKEPSPKKEPSFFKETTKISTIKETPIVDITETEEKKTLIQQTDYTIKLEAKDIVKKIEKIQKEEKTIFENEMKDSIPADVAANMFRKLEPDPKPIEKHVFDFPKDLEPNPITIKEEPKKEEPRVNIAAKKPIETEKPKKEIQRSLNDRISHQKLQVGLNDRIAFVKHLFNFSQENFNTVLSKLNSFDTEKECKDYLNVVKKDLNWSRKEEYEDRLISLIERKFNT